MKNMNTNNFQFDFQQEKPRQDGSKLSFKNLINIKPILKKNSKYNTPSASDEYHNKMNNLQSLFQNILPPQQQDKKPEKTKTSWWICGGKKDKSKQDNSQISIQSNSVKNSTDNNQIPRKSVTFSDNNNNIDTNNIKVTQSTPMFYNSPDDNKSPLNKSTNEYDSNHEINVSQSLPYLSINNPNKNKFQDAQTKYPQQNKITKYPYYN